MSRDWKATETQDGVDANGQVECAVGDTSITVTQLVVAVDGLSVVTKKGGAADMCIQQMGGLTVAQLRWIFSAETATELTAAGLDMSSVTPNGDNDDSTHKWSELNANCPDAEIVLAYPDAASGTYEYFFESILDEASQGFRAGTQSSDDNVLVNTLNGDDTAIGYFGFAYYAENQATLSAAGVANDHVYGMGDTTETAVIPDAGTVRDGSYAPLSRPLFMNVNNDVWDEVSAFLTWAYSGDGTAEISEVGYVPLDDATWQEMWRRISAEGNFS